MLTLRVRDDLVLITSMSFVILMSALVTDKLYTTVCICSLKNKRFTILPQALVSSVGGPGTLFIQLINIYSSAFNLTPANYLCVYFCNEVQVNICECTDRFIRYQRLNCACNQVFYLQM